MTIKINCLISTGLMKSIFVRPDHTMESINNVIGKMYTLIFQGSVVQKKFTVDGYNMKDGDCIFAVNSSDSKQIDKWKDISSDSKNSIMERVNKKNAIEFEKERVRIHDVSMMKMETNLRKYRRVVKRFNSVSKLGPKNVEKEETKYTRPTAICSEPLPTFW